MKRFTVLIITFDSDFILTNIVGRKEMINEWDEWKEVENSLVFFKDNCFLERVSKLLGQQPKTTVGVLLNSKITFYFTIPLRFILCKQNIINVSVIFQYSRLRYHKIDG